MFKQMGKPRFTGIFIFRAYIILNGLDEGYFYKSIETIKTVSSTELQELANKYLLPENFYELVVV